jgi:hypothetical protein
LVSFSASAPEDRETCKIRFGFFPVAVETALTADGPVAVGEGMGRGGDEGDVKK